MATTINMNQLSGAMQFTRVAFERAAEKLVKETIRRATATAVDTTPVDTGEARSNWLVSIGGPDNQQIPAHFPYPKYSGPNFGETANAVVTKDLAEIQILGYSILTDIQVYLQNNVDFIEDLNDGNVSRQSSNMVEQAVQMAEQTVLSAAFIIP